MKKTYDTVNVNGGFKGGWGGGGRLPIRSLFFPKSHHFRVKGLYKLCAFEINETVVINCLPPPPSIFWTRHWSRSKGQRSQGRFLKAPYSLWLCWKCRSIPTNQYTVRTLYLPIACNKPVAIRHRWVITRRCPLFWRFHCARPCITIQRMRTDGRTKSISAAPTRRPRRRNSCKLVNRILRRRRHRRRRNARVRVMFGRHYAFQPPTFLLNDVTNFAAWCVKKWGVFLAVVTLAMSKRWMMIMKIFISPYNGSNIQQ